MSGRIKKSSSSLSFSMSKWFRRLSTSAPSIAVISIVVIAYALFVFGGGLYTIINRPVPSAYVNGRFYFLYPQISAQFVSDTIVSVTLYALGFAGLFVIYQSTKSAYKPRQAYMMLIIGVTLFLISFLFLEGAINFKSHPS